MMNNFDDVDGWVGQRSTHVYFQFNYFEICYKLENLFHRNNSVRNVNLQLSITKQWLTIIINDVASDKRDCELRIRTCII